MRILQICSELLSLSIRTKPWNQKQFVSKLHAILIRESLERLGSVFVKFGQMLALRPDFVPTLFCDELYLLLDQVPAFESAQAIAIFQRELGDNCRQFLELDQTPIASASFAQVHKAKLITGEFVAVKIQRPNVEDVVRRDLNIMKFFARFLDFWFRPSNKLARIVEEFDVWTKDELNYVLEAKNIQKFNNIATLVGDGIRGPHVYEKLSTQKVLTMEFIDGYSLSQVIFLLKQGGLGNEGKEQQLRELGFNGQNVIHALIQNMLEMSHVHGFFHADPHPANIIFTPKKEIIFIDFGIMGSLTPKQRVLLLRYFRNLLSGNAHESLDTLLDLCGNRHPQHIDQIREKNQVLIDRFVATFSSKTYLEQQMKSGPILIEALGMLQNHGIEIPVSVVRYFKAFETVEGLIFALYPKLQIQDMLKEFRRVSIINIVDALPTKFEEKNFNFFVLKFIDVLEKSLML